MATDEPRPAIELVVLLASAGGLDSISTVLRDLPGDLPAAILVHQHLGGRSSVLPAILAERTAHRVAWALDGEVVSPGRVLVCPAGVAMELEPDGTCRLRTSPGQRRFDVLLASTAGAYGKRCVAAVLSGSGHDGAEGTLAMKRAGALVIAESPNTAEFPSMPVAAARAGADVVLPLHRIGSALTQLVHGTPLPQRESIRPAVPQEPPVSSVRACPDNPAARAELAAQRAAELRRRRQDLASGRGATAATVAIARIRAQQSLRRANQADRAAQRAAGRVGYRRPV